MAKTKISEFDVNPDNNTDINSINIAEGCAPSGINNAIRQIMADLKAFQTGADGDSGTFVGVYTDTISEKTSATGVTVDGVLLKDNGITASGTNILSGTTIPSSKTLVVTTDIGTSVQAYDADTAKTDVAQTYTAGQRGEITTLTDASSISIDLADSNNFTVTLGGNRTLSNPSNIVAGQSGSIFISQDGTGSRLLSWGSYWDFAGGGTAPTLSTSANAVDRVDYIVRSSTSIHAVFTGNYS
jgi:hypothetical protein